MKVSVKNFEFEGRFEELLALIHYSVKAQIALGWMTTTMKASEVKPEMKA